jgi:hypothetical protein
VVAVGVIYRAAYVAGHERRLLRTPQTVRTKGVKGLLRATSCRPLASRLLAREGGAPERTGAFFQAPDALGTGFLGSVFDVEIGAGSELTPVTTVCHRAALAWRSPPRPGCPRSTTSAGPVSQTCQRPRLRELIALAGDAGRAYRPHGMGFGRPTALFRPEATGKHRANTVAAINTSRVSTY